MASAAEHALADVEDESVLVVADLEPQAVGVAGVDDAPVGGEAAAAVELPGALSEVGVAAVGAERVGQRGEPERVARSSGPGGAGAPRRGAAVERQRVGDLRAADGDRAGAVSCAVPASATGAKARAAKTAETAARCLASVPHLALHLGPSGAKRNRTSAYGRPTCSRWAVQGRGDPYTCAGAGSSAISSTSPTVMTGWNVICSRTSAGTSSRSAAVALGDDHVGQPGGVRREHLLLQPADRQHAALERDLAGHADRVLHRAAASAATPARSSS